MCHVFEGAVDIGAFAQISDSPEVPDEVLFGRELAEDHLRLGEMQASYGPHDLDLAFVLFTSKPLHKDLNELFDVFHQDTSWWLL